LGSTSSAFTGNAFARGITQQAGFRKQYAHRYSRSMLIATVEMFLMATVNGYCYQAKNGRLALSATSVT
jgi:hypothetical protein